MENFNSREKNVSLPVENFSVSHGLLPNPLVSSSGNNNVSHGLKLTGNKEPTMNRRIHKKSAVDSSQWVVGWQRVNKNACQYASQDNGLRTWETDPCETLQEKYSDSLNHQIGSNCKKGLKGRDVGLGRDRNKSIVPQKNSIQVRCETHRPKTSHSAQIDLYNNQHCIAPSPDSSCHVQQNVVGLVKVPVPSQGELNGFQSYKWVKIPSREHASSIPFHAPSDSQQRSKFKLCTEDNTRQDVKTRSSKERWIPVVKKETGLLSTDSAGICCGLDDNSSLNKEKHDNNLQGNIVPLSVPVSNVSKSTSLVSSDEVTSVQNEASILVSSITEIEGERVKNTRDYQGCIKKPTETLQFLIGSRMAAEALSTAYKLQLASENVQISMGCPLAQFERLLHSATPVISSSYVRKECGTCFSDQLLHGSLCKHQVPDISLLTLWNWYEMPGNYGLGVKAEDTQNLMGLDADSISCHAHFVPSLSAVQLFGYPHLDKSGKNTEHYGSEILVKGDVQSHTSSPRLVMITSSQAVEGNHNCKEKTNLAMDLGSVEEPVSSSSPFNEPQLHNLDSTTSSSSDSELIFEFFESEQPQQRKSLHNKITELIGSGVSGNRIFGDPLKLENSKLGDLHPASWFSVAWYPIYRIPERKFRASFLTYHSLGVLTERCIPNDSVDKNTHSVVCPVLGLQSNNAQNECWFDPKLPVESSCKQWIPFNHTEIIKERLRTLEENAFHFARGYVLKNNAKICNRQPDYEFFISRRC